MDRIRSSGLEVTDCTDELRSFMDVFAVGKLWWAMGGG